MAEARKFVQIDGPFVMHRGGVLDSPVIAFETWGKLNEKRDNAILLFTGLSPSAHAASSQEDQAPGWWEDMVGPGLPLDTEHFFVICVNSLGSCYGSTGPASINPKTGMPYRLNFPVHTLEDVAEGGYQVVKHLGIDKLHSIIGCSMGGMSALALCVRHPGISAGLVSVSSATRSTPFGIAVRSLQREMIREDPKWNGGNYDPADPPISGQRLARKLGMITYRSAAEWDQRFHRERASSEGHIGGLFGVDFEVEAYLESRALNFTGHFDPNCYLYLSRASDLFDLAEHGGSLEAGFNKIKLEHAMVVGVSTDILFPLHQQQELADGLAKVVPDVRYVPLDCIQGHDSFLVNMDVFRPVICSYFETCC